MHNILRDDDSIILIDKDSRRIRVSSGGKVLSVAGDHCSEQFTFQCPRYIEGHDVSACGMHWLQWVNANGVRGTSELLVSGSDAENVRLTWTVPVSLTTSSGAVYASIHFADLDATGDVVVYKWSSAICKDFLVLESLGNELEDGVVIEYVEPETDGSGLLNVVIDEGKLNAAVYNAITAALAG